MNTLARLLCLLPICTSIAMADTSPARTLRAGTMICFKAGDWSDLVEASVDNDGDAATRLVESGKCRVIENATKVNFIEPTMNKSALIQLPSGKTAITAVDWLK